MTENFTTKNSQFPHSQAVLLLIASIFVSSCALPPEEEEHLVLGTGFFDTKTAELKSRKRAWGSLEWFSVRSFGRIAEVALSKADRGAILYDVKAVSDKSLKAWKRLKNKDIEYGAESKIETPLGKFTYRTFQTSSLSCFQFSRSFGRSVSDSEDRMTRRVQGYFCESPNKTLNNNTISEFLHQVGVTGHYIPPTAILRNDVKSTPEVKIDLKDQTRETDQSICFNSLHSGEIKWAEGSTWTPYVEQAKRRNFTPQKCAEMIGRSTQKIKHQDAKGNIEERLARLKMLVEDGLLTEDEAAEKRKEILEGL